MSIWDNLPTWARWGRKYQELEYQEPSSLPSFPKIVTFVYVHFAGQGHNEAYFKALPDAFVIVNTWLRSQGASITRWNFKRVELGPINFYDGYTPIMSELIDRGEVFFDGRHAWYLFVSDNRSLNLYGTIGGDYWGQASNVPGVSFFDETGLFALAYDEAWPGTNWTRNMACGAIAHELMHNLALIPDDPSLEHPEAPKHGAGCIMTGAYGLFPDCILERDGLIYGGMRGDEIEALISYGFAKPVV